MTTQHSALDTSPTTEDLNHSPQRAAPVTCHQCGTIDTPALGPGAGPHFAIARCQYCGAFLGWLSQYSSAEREARRQQASLVAMAQKPPSAAQLAYLAALGDDPGTLPATMAEASARIDVLRKGVWA